MTKTWEKQKVYEMKRGAALLMKLQEALDTGNRQLFKDTFIKSMRYTTKKQRAPYYREFLEKAGRKEI